jgi:hypothetical protein
MTVMSSNSIRTYHDTSFFDGVSCLLVTTDPRKTNSQINKTPHSHTKNQTRKAVEVHASINIRAMHDTNFFDEVSCLLVTADPPKTNS